MNDDRSRMLARRSSYQEVKARRECLVSISERAFPKRASLTDIHLQEAQSYYCARNFGKHVYKRILNPRVFINKQEGKKSSYHSSGEFYTSLGVTQRFVQSVRKLITMFGPIQKICTNTLQTTGHQWIIILRFDTHGSNCRSL
jgi:hypothetical protein